MATSRHRKAELARRERQRIYQLSQRITGQSHLEYILMDVGHRLTRRAVYDQIKPSLKFKSHYPDWLNEYHKDTRPPITPVTSVANIIATEHVC